MEARKHCTFCTFIGKLVLKCLAIVAIIFGAKLILEKVFHKVIVFSVEVNDVEGLESSDDEKTDGDDEEEEEDEDEEEDAEDFKDQPTEE